MSGSFWVIERYVNGRLCFWASGARGRSSRDDWSEDFDFAIHFADKQSAEIVLLHTCDGEGRAAEHVYMRQEGETDA